MRGGCDSFRAKICGYVCRKCTRDIEPFLVSYFIYLYGRLDCSDDLLDVCVSGVKIIVLLRMTFQYVGCFEDRSQV